MNNKFNYPIFPDRTYTLSYEGIDIKVSGEEILAMFYRKAMMDKFISELSKETELSTDNHISDDLDTPDFKLFDE